MPNPNASMPQEDDMYSDAISNEPKEEAQEGDGNVAMLPKEVAPNAKPGDYITVCVKSVHEKELMVTVEGSEPEEKDEHQPEQQPQDDEMASMME